MNQPEARGCNRKRANACFPLAEVMVIRKEMCEGALSCRPSAQGEITVSFPPEVSPLYSRGIQR